jgi:hypothetical protein
MIRAFQKCLKTGIFHKVLGHGPSEAQYGQNPYPISTTYSELPHIKKIVCKTYWQKECLTDKKFKYILSKIKKHPHIQGCL